MSLTPLYLNSNEVFDTKEGTVPCIAGVGVTCHELSHALGLPDFYPTSASAQVDNQEMEYWDLMDGGEYGDNGFYPTAYTAWEKKQMGWPVVITELDGDQQVTIANSTEEGGTAYKITNPDNSNEYFMLESIQRKGWSQITNTATACSFITSTNQTMARSTSSIDTTTQKVIPAWR